jgi:hypothetical protein
VCLFCACLLLSRKTDLRMIHAFFYHPVLPTRQEGTLPSRPNHSLSGRAEHRNQINRLLDV